MQLPRTSTVKRIVNSQIALPVVLALLCGACGDASVSFCSGGPDFCANPPFSREPIADAGPDQRVVSGDLVTLDGRGSDAVDGIRSFSWVQTAGPSVVLTDGATAQPSFTAPDVDDAVEIVFRLTIVDDHDDADSDSSVVTVEPLLEAATRDAAVVLARHLKPMALTMAPACLAASDETAETASPAEAALTGIWLAARIRAFAAPDVEPTEAQMSEFLDETRGIVAWLGAALPNLRTTIAAQFVRGGTDALARWARPRDPALAAAAFETSETLAHGAGTVVARDSSMTAVLARTAELASPGASGLALFPLPAAARDAALLRAAALVRAAATSCHLAPEVRTDVDRLSLTVGAARLLHER